MVSLMMELRVQEAEAQFYHISTFREYRGVGVLALGAVRLKSRPLPR